MDRYLLLKSCHCTGGGTFHDICLPRHVSLIVRIKRTALNLRIWCLPSPRETRNVGSAHPSNLHHHPVTRSVGSGRAPGSCKKGRNAAARQNGDCQCRLTASFFSHGLFLPSSLPFELFHAHFCSPGVCLPLFFAKSSMSSFLSHTSSHKFAPLGIPLPMPQAIPDHSTWLPDNLVDILVIPIVAFSAASVH